MVSPQKYTIDKAEIDRRKKAFSSFLIFSLIGISLSLKLLLGLSYFPWFVLMGILSAVLFISRLLMHKAFGDISKMVVTITDEYVERIVQKGSERNNLCDIDKVSITMTLRKSVREICIFSKDKKLFLNGMMDFNTLSEVLQGAVGKKIKIVRTREPIDYDSLYFYPIFGLLLGASSILFLKFLINSYNEFTRILLILFMVFVVGLGGYFIYSKPMTRSNGLRFHFADTVMGIVFMVLGMGLLYFILVKI